MGLEFDGVAEIASNLVDPAEFPDEPHVAPDSIEKGTGRLLGYRTIAEDGVRSGKHRFYAGQILYSKIRPNLSKVVTVDFGGLCSADMYPINPKIDRGYLHVFMLSWTFLSQVTADDNRLAMPKVNQRQLSAVRVTVLPLAEQHRIVARVDELMGLLDRLEAARATYDDLRRKARDAALAALREAEDAEEVEAAWGRIAREMDDLFTEPEDVAPLRQAVLELAVRGRLTAGDSSAWQARSLGDLLEDGLTNGWSPKAVDYPTAVKTLRLSATTRGVFDPSEFKYIEPADRPLDKYWLHPGDLLIQRSNTPEYVGMAAIFDGPGETFIYPDLMMRGRVRPNADSRFVHLALLSPGSRAYFREQASGTSQSMVKLSQAKAMGCPLLVPPLMEQHRIVAKVDALMALCDALEARLTAARDLHGQFAAAAVHHLDAA